MKLNKMMLILFLCVILFISQVQASAVIIASGAAAAAANAERHRQDVVSAEQLRGYCAPPKQFALENNCTLNYIKDISVHEFKCENNKGTYNIISFCDGTINKVDFNSIEEIHKSEEQVKWICFILIGIMCVPLILLIFLLVRG